MKISVIIPVYNAAKYIKKAVESALDQPEAGEIVLIDDASPDDSLTICQELDERHARVRLLRHDDRQNHGAGASRNLGIRNAKFDYVAFLDADDFYLKGRFIKARELFEQYTDIDGVYEAIGMYFYSDQAKEKWFSSGEIELTTITEGIDSRYLFEALLEGCNGYLHLDGLVVKKKIFKNCGYFYEHLKLHQDTAIIIQMSEYGKLIPGQLSKPVALRGIHDENRILSDYNKIHTRLLLWKTLFYWAHSRNLKISRLIILFYKYLFYLYQLKRLNESALQKNFSRKHQLILESLKHPILTMGVTFKFLLKKVFT